MMNANDPGPASNHDELHRTPVVNGHLPRGALRGLQSTNRNVPSTAADRCTVLICDDRDELRAAIIKVLANVAKFEVIGEAVDGAGCLAMVHTAQPDVLILDIGMPGGGPHVAKAARALRPAMHILVFSGIRDDKVRAEMLRAGADEYLVKTGRLRPLLEAMDRAFTHHSRLR
jgi:DNA-binding NarL/FixJ family response regulator